MTTSGDSAFTVLFDPGVSLSEGGNGLHDPHSGMQVLFKERIHGGSGILRENGSGWSIEDIEQFFAVDLPRNCPRDNVMRLHHMRPQPD